LILKLKRSPGIHLVGFMGCGKSTVARLLADEIGWRFTDLDSRIEAEQQQSIAHLFDTLGEPGFREIEGNTLQALVREIQRGRATVSALGGGAFVWPGNCERLEDAGVTIWLDVPFERIQARIGISSERPLARDPERFARLFAERRAAYAKADYTIPFDSDNPHDAVQAILELHLLG
jgi:shikimate kinase